MSKAIWKGAVKLGRLTIPVGLYSAESSDDLEFRLIDRRNHSPVRYLRVNEATGEEVHWDDIVKGYEYEKGRYVFLTEEEIRQANPEASRTLDIQGFVKTEAIDPLYYDKPYYLAPEENADQLYALLRETLRRTGKIAIGYIVIRTRQYLAAVLPEGKCLVLMTLRYAHEVRDNRNLHLPALSVRSAGIGEKELSLAERLVNDMSMQWDPDAFNDEFREDIMEMIHRKIEEGRAEEIAEMEPEEEMAEDFENVIDIMDLLKKSVEEAEQKKHKEVEPKEEIPLRQAPRRMSHAAATARRKNTRRSKKSGKS